MPSPVTAKRPSASMHQRAGLLAPGAQPAQHLHALDRLRDAPVSPISSRHGFTLKIGERPDGGGAAGASSRIADRPRAPALEQRLHAVAHRRPHEDVQPVAGLDLARPARQQRLAVALEHAHQRLARQLELVHVQARRSRRSRPPGTRAPRRPAAGSSPPRAAGGDSAGSSVVTPEPARERLERRALDQRGGEHHEEDDVEEVAALLDRPRSRGTWRARSAPRRAARPSPTSADSRRRKPNGPSRSPRPAAARRRSAPRR